MSLLSRMTAPPVTSELAGMVNALLSTLDNSAPAQLALPPVSAGPSGPAGPAAGRVIDGPTGLGTAAARIPFGKKTPVADGAPAPPPDARSRAPSGPTGLGTTSLAPAQRPAGGAPVPQLYCPPPIRDNPALGAAVNDALIDWAERIGLYPGRLEQVRAANFGRLIMLTHPDTDDPDRLLAATKCALAEWSVDDHYCDDETAAPTRPRWARG